MLNQVKSAYEPTVAHQAGLYPSFYSSVKWLGVFLLPPGWNASLSQGYPPALSSPVLTYTTGWREVLWESSVLPKNTTQCLRPELDPASLDQDWSGLTMRPRHLHTQERTKGNRVVPLHKPNSNPKVYLSQVNDSPIPASEFPGASRNRRSYDLQLSFMYNTSGSTRIFHAPVQNLYNALRNIRRRAKYYILK